MNICKSKNEDSKIKLRRVTSRRCIFGDLKIAG